MKLSHLLLCVAVLAASDEVYKKPPKDVLDVLNAPSAPRANVSPAHDYVLLAEPLRYPPIAALAQPMLRLAGLRINPATNGPHRGFWYKSMALKRIRRWRRAALAAISSKKPARVFRVNHAVVFEFCRDIKRARPARFGPCGSVT